MSNKNGHRYEFGDFRLDSEPPSLWRDERLVPLPPKALEMLLLFVRRRDIIVSREELLNTVWRETFVEEGNINYTVSLLRKVLDKDNKGRFIQTVPKRGYCFVADVLEVSANGHAENAVRNVEAAISNEQRKPKIRWHFIGIVLLGVLFVTGFVIWRASDEKRKLSITAVTNRNIRTVAVLPLKTSAENEGSKSLSLGLTDSLISRLGSLNRFSVRPLSSVRGYGDAEQDPLKFGETLKVDVILEGTLHQTDNRLLVNVRLWDLRDRAQLWEGSFDSTEADFFKLQDAVATGVTRGLVSELLEKEHQLLAKRYTDNPEAYELYLKGLYHSYKWTDEGFRKSIEYFEKALEKDPEFAPAYAKIADYYHFSSHIGLFSPQEIFPKWKDAAQRALEIDEGLADAHLAMAHIYFYYERDWAKAEREFERAVELNPNSTDAHKYYGLFLASRERFDQAVTEGKKALALDPLSIAVNIVGGFIYLFVERLDDALGLVRQMIELDSNAPQGYWVGGSLLMANGKYKEAIEAFQKSLSLGDNQMALAKLGCAYGLAGRRDEALKILDQLFEMRERQYAAPFNIARVYAGLGDNDNAFEWMEKAVEERDADH